VRCDTAYNIAYQVYSQHDRINPMKLSPCRFKLPLRDNMGQAVEPEALLDLRRELNENFQGYTVHATSQGHWQSQAGRVYEEEIVVYEVAIPEERVSFLRDLVCRFGLQLGQLAMYFDAPAPSVEIIDLSGMSPRARAERGGSDESRSGKTTRRRGKKNRPQG
jgi:hypothetical protein